MLIENLNTCGDFFDLRFGLCGLSRAETARLLRVSPGTVRRWERGHTQAPYSARALLAVLAGDLGTIGPEWAGFRLYGGLLHTPNGIYYSPAELQAALWLKENAFLLRQSNHCKAG